MQARHLQEFIDQEKTKVKKIEVRPNPRFDRERKDSDNTLEEDLSIKTMHMIGDPHDPKLENRI